MSGDTPDFNIDNYGIDELLDIFGITSPLKKEAIMKIAAGFIEKYQKLKQTTYVEFFSKAMNKLVSNYNLVEGIFFAKLICEQEGKEVEIDSRTSDAIALAVRFECPIYTFEFVLSSAGIILDDDDAEDLEEINSEINLEEITKNPTERMSLKELKKHLKKSIDNEDYEAASRFRDEINKRKEN